MKPSVRSPPRNRGYLSRPPRAFCFEKDDISCSGYHSKFHRILRLPRKVNLEFHQILRLARKMNLMIDPWHKWNVIYNARSNMRHSLNSPNTAPATKNNHPKSQRNLLKTDKTSLPMRGRSDHETVSPQPASQPRLPFTPTTSIFSFQISPNTAPATKTETWTSPNTAPTRKSGTCTSPNIAPATKNDPLTSPNTAPVTKMELLLDWAMPWLSYDLTELWLDWAMTWLSCDSTELWRDWAVTWLNCDLTELWLDWAVTWMSCDLTELWLDWAEMRCRSYIGSFST